MRRPHLSSLLRTAALVVTAALVASACSGVYRYNVTLPDVPTSAQSSIIFDSGGNVITTLHGEQNREIVTLDQINPTLLCAVVAIEDERFWEHEGVDIRGLARAFVRNAEAGEVVEGGSTITQQLIDVTFRDPDATEAGGKAREIIRAIQLEQEFAKETILERYLNIVYFGASAYGAEAAAEQYFDIHATDLTWAQSSLVAGLIQAPSRLDPYRNPAGATERRLLVLDNILRLSLEGQTPYCNMTQEQYDEARATPVAPVVRPEEQYRAGHYVEAVKHWILYDEDFGQFLADRGYQNTLDARESLLLEGGLRIETAIDMRLQDLAEAAVAGVLTDPAWPLGAMTVVDPTNGHVVAMVGGPNFWDPEYQYAQYDFASVGRRQTGSSFKPFVLAAALEQGISPYTVVDAPSQAEIDIGGGQVWRPRNADGSARGPITLIQATENSVNTAYANLMTMVGPQAAIDMAARLGVQSPMQPFYSAVLGTNDLSTLDMASAYATFAARGVRHPAVFVTRISLADGTVLYEATGDPALQSTEVLDPRIADTVNAILTEVVCCGTAARNGPLPEGRPAAGKTGSTNDLTNAYFVGYTYELVAAVWVGYPGENLEMRPPTTPFSVFGGTWPTMIWNSFMSAALEGTPIQEFQPMPDWPTPTTTTAAPIPVSLPNVVGMPLDQARAALAANGFTTQELQEPSALPPGTVIRQDPAGGQLVRTDVPITLVYAVPSTSTVPGVVGQSATAAAAAVSAAGFVPQVVVEASPSFTPDQVNMVWQQNPAPGTALPPGSAVTIWANPAAAVGPTTTTGAPTTTTVAPTTTSAAPGP